MSFNCKNLLELLSKTEEECKSLLEQVRWKDGMICPHCNSESIYKYQCRPIYKCKDCKKQFSAKYGTIFENSPLSAKQWVAAFALLLSDKKGISSIQLAEQIGTTQRTAWYMLQRIRGTLLQDDRMLTGEVQSDESFIGGANKNRHKDKKVTNSQGRSFKDKVPVMGLYHVETKTVRAFVIKDTGAAELRPILIENIKQGATLMSDEWVGYNGLSSYYAHRVVNHAGKQYVNEGATTNAIENFWSHLKRMIFGNYHWTSRKHLQLYVNEEVFRFNTREMKSISRLEYALNNVYCPTKYKKLIA